MLPGASKWIKVNVGPVLTSVRIAVFALVLFIGGVVYIDIQQKARFQAKEKQLVSETLATHGALLESELQNSMAYATALRSFVLSRLARDEVIDDTSFQTFVKSLPNTDKTIIGLQLAPAAIIGFVYPKADKHLIGIDLLDLTRPNATVHRAIATRQLIVDGPRMLSQKVVGLVARYPVFIENRYWGFSTVIIDFERLLQVSKITADSKSLNIAIRGKDGLGSQGEVFYGSEQVFLANPILKSVNFKNGSWQIAALPQAGWSTGWPGREWFLGFAVTISYLILHVAWRNSRWKYQRRHHAQDENETTGNGGVTLLAGPGTLHQHLEREWKRASRMQSPLALLMIEIDHFHVYKDFYGDLVGDRCLFAVAQAIKNVAQRPADLAARMEDGKYLLALPETSRENSLKVADHLRQGVYRLQLAHVKNIQSEFVSVSIGIACVEPAGNGNASARKIIQELIDSADKQLHRAKEKGPNQVCS